MEYKGYLKPGPKNRLEDFYNYRKEVEQLKLSLDNPLITCVTGVRRVGKTSLVLSTVYDYIVHNKKTLFLHADLRGATTKDSFYTILLQAHEYGAKNLEYKSDLVKEFDDRLKEELASIIKTVSKEFSLLSIAKYSETLTKKLREAGLYWFRSYLELYNDICREMGIKCILFLDELHEPVYSIGGNFIDEVVGSLAYSSDYHRNIKIIISGSIIRLVEEIISKEQLVGRVTVIEMEELSASEVIDFLRKTLKLYEKELGLKDRTIELISITPFPSILTKLTNGVIGWLVIFTRYLVDKMTSLRKPVKPEYIGQAVKDSINMLIKDMEKTGKEELSFIKKYRRDSVRVIRILRLLSKGIDRIEELEDVVKYPRKQLLEILDWLEKRGLIRRIINRYKVADPTIRIALEVYPSQEEQEEIKSLGDILEDAYARF